MDKRTLLINFAQGMDTKTDPWQLPFGKFLSLTNMIFQTPLMMRKRDGYGDLLASPPSGTNYLTTLNNNLLAIGTSISGYSQSLNRFITKGTLQPCSLSVMPLIRNNLNQIQVDSASANGNVCVVYTSNYGTPTGAVTSYLYAVEDALTGQNIVGPTALPVLSTGAINGSSRIFVVGNYFVIVSPVVVSSVTYLQYVSIPLNNTTLISAAQNVYPEAYVPITGNPGWDGGVSNNTLVVAYNTTAGAQGIHVTTLTAAQISANQTSGLVHAFANAVNIGAIVSVCVDTTASPNIIYISFWNNSTQNGYTCAVNISFGAINTQFTPQKIISSLPIANLASCAQNGSATVYSEGVNALGYDSSIPRNFITAVTVSSSGSVGSPFAVIGSLGLASKAFIINGIQYFLGAYQSTFQSTYFLINGSSSTTASPVIVAKLAYQNGGGYLALGLPSVSIQGTTAEIAYLFKQDVEALNTQNNTQQTSQGGIYSQLGINQASFNLGTQVIQSIEAEKNLHLSGGYLSMFDGFYPVEHNFFLFPDSVEATWNGSSAVTPTGTWASGATVITVSSATGISPGMSITDTSNAYIPAGTSVVYVNGTSVTISNATTHSASGDNLSIQGNIHAQPDGSTNTDAYGYMVTYEWTDMEGNAFRSQPSIAIFVSTSSSGTAGIITLNIPTYRITQKVSNPVKIVIYRWSVANENYYQVTSIFAPLLNSTTTDYVTFVDTLPDAQIIGNNLIYTTGGVVPDCNAPATNIMTLFDTRLVVVPAEDPNTILIGKSLVEAAPVEMCLPFSVYISPTIGTTSDTGPIRAAGPMDDKLILFKKNAIYYMNGAGPDNLGTTSQGSPLGNYSQPIFITSVVGSTNQNSLVLIPAGLMFQSDKGIWIVRRNLDTDYIGWPMEAFNSSVVTSAHSIPGYNYVVFTLNTGQMIIYDYVMDQWGTFQGASAISSCIYNNLHTILTPYNQLWQQTPGKYLDGSNPVLLSMLSGWINLAGLQGYQRFYEFYLLAKYISPHILNIGINYDYNGSVVHQSEIFPNNFNGSIPSPFGIPVPFGGPINLEQWRIHTKLQLCQSFQISIQEVFDPSFGTVAGAGFTLSGLSAKVGIKKGLRPIRGANAVG